MEAFLSLSLQELSRYVRWMVSTNFSSRNSVDDGLVSKLEGTVSAASGVLNTAEGKQITNKTVRRWLLNLKEAICSAEDLVDEIGFDAVQSDLDSQSGYIFILKVRKLSPFRYNFTKKMEKRIQKILDLLNDIVEKRYLLGLTTDTISFQVPCEASLVEEYDIFGRDADREAIINLLYGIGNDRVSVIPIVGMGGIGKTALAQLVFNDIVKTDSDNNESGQHFTIKEWFMASNQSDVSALIKTIYERVTRSDNCGIQEKLRLQMQLKMFLKDKRILIVLDNVWNLSYQSWCELKISFESAAYGSKILVTTRNENIGKTIGSVPNHYVELLSEEDGWKLFSKHTFNHVHPSAHPELEEIGKKIVQKCKGLPLAIKSLAGLLHKDLNPKKWNNVLKDEIWDLQCEILPALWLSYYYLPSYLKRCFAYCSIFPKGYEFEKKKKKLILLWMAEGLLLHEDNKMPEDIGEDYFGDLASRSLFHKDRIYGFIMHDLMNDLAKFVAGESYFRLDANSLKVPLKTVRHLSWTTHEPAYNNKLRDFSKNKVLRTLLPLNGGDEMKKEFLVQPKKLKKFQYLRVLSLYRVDNVVKLLDSIGKLKLLRYLDLSFTEIQEVPARICCMHKLQTLLLHHCSNLKRLTNSIGNLKQLRYLDLSETKVEEIPETVCNLHNLHTLLLGSCRKLTYLPTNMETLTNLRHLDIRATSLREMPLQISKLSHLEMLSDFVVGTNSESNIKGLGKLQSLTRNLTIRNLETVENVDDVAEANLKDNKHITDLCLEWTVVSGDSQKAQEVLSRLKPQTDLEVLSIKNYGGIAFPYWIGDPSFSHMVKIWLSKCKRCQSLPPLGQLPSLKSLHIDGFDMMKTIGDEFYTSGLSVGAKPFLSLKKLVFKFMPQWKEWSSVDGEVFSQLRELHLIECPSLTINVDCFPKNLPCLKRLWIENCQQQVVASLLSGEHQSLGYLCIRNYLGLKSFPDTSFPTTIREVEIYECKNLQEFSEEGLLSNLTSLSICRCEKLFMPPMLWSLKTLTSLTSLHFNSIDKEVNSFPEDGQLPASLTSLKLSNLDNLKSLNGTALKLLISLHELSIYDCDELSCLPKEGLPKSLTLLDIRSCDLLNARCQRGGEDWKKIDHISRICIDNQDI